MSRRANPAIIGGFVIGAIAIAIVAILVLAPGDLLNERPRFVLFFDGSVKGLNVGAPVVFRGVKVGEVVDITVEYDTDAQRFYVPVYVEIDLRRIQVVGSESRDIMQRYPDIRIDRLVERGLRGQLVLQSFLTGQLLVQFDFYPERPGRLLVGIDEDGIEEIPTIRTAIQELEQTLEEYPVEQVLSDISGAMAGVRRLVESREVYDAVRNFDAALESVKGTMATYESLGRNLDAGVEPLLADLQTSLDELRAAAAAVQTTLQSADTALATIDQAAGTADLALGSAKRLLEPDSPVVYQLDIALQELAAAARSVRALADTLERQPESIFQGKRSAKQ